MTLSLDIAGGQIVGARRRQEDAYRIDAESPAPAIDAVLALADGMGGHPGGDVASRLAVDRFVATVRAAGGEQQPREIVERALHAANDAVGDEARARPDLAGMGTTLVGAVVADDVLHWASVGDSLLWLWRAGGLVRLNADHSIGHVLLEAVNGEPLDMLDVGARPLAVGDVLVLASDGIETLDETGLADRVAQGRAESATAVVEDVLAAIEARADSVQDNVTLVVARVR